MSRLRNDRERQAGVEKERLSSRYSAPAFTTNPLRCGRETHRKSRELGTIRFAAIRSELAKTALESARMRALASYDGRPGSTINYRLFSRLHVKIGTFLCESPSCSTVGSLAFPPQVRHPSLYFVYRDLACGKGSISSIRGWQGSLVRHRAMGAWRITGLRD